MSDDIVTRLRGLACPECGLPSTHNHFEEAADEIERLRKEVAYLKTPCPRCDYEEPNE